MIISSNVQIKFTNQQNRHILSELKASDTCGIFLKFERERLLEPFLENMIEENTQLGDTNVFKSHIWFIFAKKIENLRLIFQFDS